MNYVDIILQYLSGDLSEKDAKRFEKDLDLKGDLKEEFRQIKLVLDKLEEELSSEKGNIEKNVRDIIVEHDLDIYGGQAIDKDEISFQRILKENIEKEPSTERKNSILRSPLFYFVVAASIAIIMILIMPDSTPEQLFAQYYKPSSDKFLTQLTEYSRGDVQVGILLYRKELYKESIAHFKPYIQQEDPDPHIRLFYALASIEENSTEDLSILFEPANSEVLHEIEYSLVWYSSLYLIHEKEIAKAINQLRILTEQKNPYFKQAKSLLRKID